MQMGWYDRKICRVRDLSCGDTRIFLELEVRRLDCRNCGKVKRERLDFLADNPHYTKRFAYYVGRRCRSATIKDVAADLRLDWHTVKTLDRQYMQAQLARAGRPGPQVIGIDEIAIRKGHTYRIVVSDLLRGRPIWFGGKDRSEASMSEFYVWLGAKKSGRIRLAVMDTWRPFRLATAAHAPNAAILFDKFHVMRHLGEALDAVRKSGVTTFEIGPGPREEHAKHKHTTCDEIVYCVSGRGVEGIETSPGKFEEFEYAAGTTLHLPRGVGHYTRNPDYFENLHLVGIFVGVPNMDKETTGYVSLGPQAGHPRRAQRIHRQLRQTFSGCFAGSMDPGAPT